MSYTESPTLLDTPNPTSIGCLLPHKVHQNRTDRALESAEETLHRTEELMAATEELIRTMIADVRARQKAKSLSETLPALEKPKMVCNWDTCT